MTHVVHQIGLQQQEQQQAQQQQEEKNVDQVHLQYDAMTKVLEETGVLDLSFYQLKDENEEEEEQLESEASSYHGLNMKLLNFLKLHLKECPVRVMNVSRNELSDLKVVSQHLIDVSNDDNEQKSRVSQKLVQFSCSHNELRHFDIAAILKSHNQSLEQLDVSCNRLKSFGVCSDVEQESGLTRDNESIVLFEKLAHLNLSNNRNLMSLDANLSVMMPNIVELDLSSASLTSQVLLESLFRVNKLADPNSVHPLAQLKKLSLGRNKLTGDNFPLVGENVSLYHLPCLEELDLEDNQISGLNDEWLQSMTKLKILSVSHNKLTHLNSILFDENVFEYLHSLLADHNQIEHIPRVVKHAKGDEHASTLVDLRLHKNMISEIGYGQLFAPWSQLKNILLNNNKLRQLPEDIGCLSNIEELYLQGNELTSIPASIGQLVQLKELDLYDNELSSIPAELGKLIELKNLMLDNNQLQTIPNDIVNLTKLQMFSFRGNDQLHVSPFILAMRTDK